ncbi:Protein of unknown function [Cotesia congregata]|uniref:Uncharacterized protein n=1 Tax=Cotesia congregata TaxID=51543 RepID=A0A8J2MIZ2_COTCN|nr:Protein of unknown function [Cotesia congregata]
MFIVSMYAYIYVSICVKNIYFIWCKKTGLKKKRRDLNKFSFEIWSWCEQRRLWLFASYIPSQENTKADLVSRVDNIDAE